MIVTQTLCLHNRNEVKAMENVLIPGGDAAAVRVVAGGSRLHIGRQDDSVLNEVSALHQGIRGHRELKLPYVYPTH